LLNFHCSFFKFTIQISYLQLLKIKDLKFVQRKSYYLERYFYSPNSIITRGNKLRGVFSRNQKDRERELEGKEEWKEEEKLKDVI